MNSFKTMKPFLIILLIAIAGFILTLTDIIFNLEIMIYILVSFIILLMILFILFILLLKKEKITQNSIEEFEKTLKGGLYHFKCPSCNGIFAVKKSKKNNKKTVKMTCPDCGMIGFIPSHPEKIEEEIPEKKSLKANFKCISCGESITIWAEGTELHKKINVYTCPFCGIKKPLKRF